MMTSRPRRDAIRKAAKAVAESTQLICDDLDQFHDLRRAVWRFVHWADHTSANQHEWSAQVEILRAALNRTGLIVPRQTSTSGAHKSRSCGRP